MKNKSKAFSLVEVMTSVFLVSVGLLASLSLLTKGLNETIGSRDQIIASLLAQEGVELVRSIRDNNWANGVSTFEGIEDSDDQRIDYEEGSLSSVGDEEDFKLKRNNKGFYQYADGDSTKFSRRIIISSNGDNEEVISMVVWNGREENIFKDASEDSDLDEDNCNTVNECAYEKDILTKWGGD